MIYSDFFQKSISSSDNFTKMRARYTEYLPGFFANNVFALGMRSANIFNRPQNESPYYLGKYSDGEFLGDSKIEEAYGMRGYFASPNMAGNNLSVASAEYSFPVLQKDLGSGLMPLMLRDIWFNVFGEAGSVWDNMADINKPHFSCGAELNMRITIGYNLDINGAIGYARGLGSTGENQVYFSVFSDVF